MLFFNPIRQFGANSAFAFGYTLGNRLGNSVFGPAMFPAGNFGYATNIFSAFPPFNSASNFGFNNFSFNQMSSLNNFGNSSFFGDWALAPQFNFGVGNFGSPFNTNFFARSSDISTFTIANISEYNAEKGRRLAEDALRHSPGKFTHYCARHVSNALERTGLNTNMNRANGYGLAAEFKKNPNFKEIAVSDVDWKHLPAGCILLYRPGSQGYSEEWGHVEITTGKGTAVSDGITHNIRKPDTIFVPV